MKSILYSRWDGTQAEFSLDVERVLDELSDLLMEGLNIQEALEWMRRAGFEFSGMDMRVMGTEELVEELRREAQSLYDRYDVSEALDDWRRRLEDLLDREQQALRQSAGFESARLNDFLERRHEGSPAITDTIERFRDHEFADETAREEFQELLEELDRLSDLESFMDHRGGRFRGQEKADYETAQSVREQIEALEQMMESLARGDLESVSPEELAEWLGEDASRSLILLLDLESSLERAGYLRGGDEASSLTPRAIRRIGAQALAEVYGDLRKDRVGSHETDHRGAAIARPDETRPFEFGDPLDLDIVRTLMNGLRRRALEGRFDRSGAAARSQSQRISLTVDDFERREFDHGTMTTTVLLLDMSWSMSWAGRFAAAKRVAIALDHLIRSRFPRDQFFVVGFSTRARELKIQDLPEASWDMGDPFTNLQEGLLVAEDLIGRHPSSSPQILVITDGQPTAYAEDGELHVEWPMGFGGVSPNAVAATMKQVRRITRRGITINTFMLDDSPELVGFVEHMTQINRGRAMFSTPNQLGSFLMVDYLDGRKKRRV
ncbi:hypothetical protein MK489_12920 [Myxococcota bacterium]|nr:hypothetical protein [Myxococcota bacterium]